MQTGHCEAARSAFERGNFRVAVARLRALHRRSDEDDLLLAECLAITGPFEDALAIVRKFDDSDVPHVRARATNVRAKVASHTRAIGDAIPLYERAIALADSSETVGLACRVRLDYFNALGIAGLPLPDTDSYNKLKTDVLRVGDPALLAGFHVCACTLEAARGNLSLAIAHASLAKAHLRSLPNPSSEAGLALAQANIAAFEQDVDRVMDFIERAWVLSQASGNIWHQFAALISMAHLHLRLGRFNDARLALVNAERFSTGSPTAQAVALETRAEAALAEGHLSECARLVAEANDCLGTDRFSTRSWYRFSIYQTEIRLAAANGDWNRVAQISQEAVTLASDRNDALLEANFKCYIAEAYLMQGDWRTSIPILTESLLAFVFPPAALRCNLHRVSSLYFKCTGLEKEAAASMGSASQIARAMSDLLGTFEVSGTAARMGCDSVPTPSDEAFDSPGAAMQFADQPRVLSECFFRHLKQKGGVRVAAVYRTRGSNIEVGDTFGISPDEARRVIKSPKSGFENVIAGEIGGRTYGLLVAEPRDIEGAIALMSVRRLAVTAIVLQKSLDEEKSRHSMWGDREIAVAAGGIYIAPAMLELLETARRIAPLNVPVLLTGETGVGKEVVARTIHESSKRAARPFIPFNCSAVPRDMVESQLFGYRRGAFTGAHENFSGVIRAASGGTVFLDEIGDLPLDIQPKLLRFLETAEVHPLGEPEPVKVDVRVIAATNVDLEALVAQGRFRTDLYYRLNVVPLPVPPLRERREEIPALANLYLRRYAEEFDRGVLTFAPETLEMLVTYTWPGNVRQLANEIRRVAALARADSAITPVMLSRDIVKTTADSVPSRPVIVEQPAKLPISLDQALGEAVASLEAAMIRRALAKTGGHVDEAATMLGLSRKGLFLKRKRLGISAPES